MKSNVGRMDRNGRIVLGLVLLMAPLLFLSGDARWLALIGLVPLATGVLQWCPLYMLFGASTCRFDK